MRQLANDIAERINPATAPTAVIVPTKGLSLIGVQGGAIANPEADAALVERLRERLAGHIAFEAIDDSINSPAFAGRVAEVFLSIVAP